MIRDNSSWPTMRKDDPAGSLEGIAVWKESGRKEGRRNRRWGKKRDGGTREEGNGIKFAFEKSSLALSPRVFSGLFLCLGRGWTRAKASNVNPSAYDVMTVLDIPWTKGGKSIGRKPAPLPRRRLCFVSRRLVCFARAIEPAQKLPTRPSYASNLFTDSFPPSLFFIAFQLVVCSGNRWMG